MKLLAPLALLASAVSFGQTPPPRLEFEVASIKPSGQMAPGQLNVGMHVDGAQFRCNFFSLKDYVRVAYKVKDYQISGPEWIGSQRFDISAKLPDGAKSEQVPDMVQTLLADRFQMKMHRETRDFPVYALIVGKGGSKMKESPPEVSTESGDAGKDDVSVTASPGRGGATVNMGKRGSFSVSSNRIEGKKMTMAGAAETLARFADRPIVDMTGLKGNYDFALEFSPDDFRAMMIRAAIAAGMALPPEALKMLDGASGEALFSAIQTLGLKLEPRKAPLEFLIIDRVEKTPTEN